MNERSEYVKREEHEAAMQALLEMNVDQNTRINDLESAFNTERLNRALARLEDALHMLRRISQLGEKMAQIRVEMEAGDRVRNLIDGNGSESGEQKDE